MVLDIIKNQRMSAVIADQGVTVMRAVGPGSNGITKEANVAKEGSKKPISLKWFATSSLPTGIL